MCLVSSCCLSRSRILFIIRDVFASIILMSSVRILSNWCVFVNLGSVLFRDAAVFRVILRDVARRRVCL